jgi:hypothetical protein
MRLCPNGYYYIRLRPINLRSLLPSELTSRMVKGWAFMSSHFSPQSLIFFRITQNSVAILNVPCELVAEILDQKTLSSIRMRSCSLIRKFVARFATSPSRRHNYGDISTYPTRFCKEFLIRSKSAPITLIMTSRSGRLQVDCETLRPHVNRICAVNVELEPRDILRDTARHTAHRASV